MEITPSILIVMSPVMESTCMLSVRQAHARKPFPTDNALHNGC